MRYSIRVDGVEMDHADTLAEARRHESTLIYGGLGTEATITIEKEN